MMMNENAKAVHTQSVNGRGTAAMLDTEGQREPAPKFNRSKLLRYLVIVLICCVPSILFLLWAWPGFFQADHQMTIASIAEGQPSQWHSLVWGYLAFPLLYLSPSYGWYGFAQIACFTLCVVFSIFRLESMGYVKAKGSVILACVFGLMPIFVIYNSLYASDIVFAYVVLVLTVLLLEIVHTQGKAFSSIWFCVVFGLSLFFAYELRKNALLIVVFGAVALFLAYRWAWRRLVAIFGAIGVGAVILGLVFSVGLHAEKSPSQEMLSVPSQQIARTFVDGGDMSQESKDVFLSIRSEQEWKENYNPTTADPEKKDIQLTAEFVKAWADTGLRNPRTYVRAYIDLMSPYWTMTPNVAALGYPIDFGDHRQFTLLNCDDFCETDYVEQFHEKPTDNQSQVSLLYSKWNGSRIPLVPDLTNFVMFNRALPLWLFLIGFIIMVVRKRVKDYLIVTLPLWCVLLSLLAFSPLASLRYAMEVGYCLPVVALMLWKWGRRNKAAADTIDAQRE